MAKLPVILGNLDITIDNVSSDFPNYVNSSYIPMKQFEHSSKTLVTFEVEEFVPCIPKHTQPFTIYNNHLYVYPKSLKYDSQKSFAKVSEKILLQNSHCGFQSCFSDLGLSLWSFF
ncbi:dedicator of cytokinesis protein 9-like [Gracilinanus agilis]|uniref:dedicator of cytokinesis protein 9-like n=1 Tax=Gracilinanus agilis TaxID=191870 RepID=UPI001CFE2E17|nr:dedicator of cytokinesis protein 9-like [Gracilinanus agilis]